MSKYILVGDSIYEEICKLYLYVLRMRVRVWLWNMWARNRRPVFLVPAGGSATVIDLMMIRDLMMRSWE